MLFTPFVPHPVNTTTFAQYKEYISQIVVFCVAFTIYYVARSSLLRKYYKCRKTTNRTNEFYKKLPPVDNE